MEPKELANVDASAIAEWIPDLQVEEKAEQLVMFGWNCQRCFLVAIAIC